MQPKPKPEPQIIETVVTIPVTNEFAAMAWANPERFRLSWRDDAGNWHIAMVRPQSRIGLKPLVQQVTLRNGEISYFGADPDDCKR